MQLAIEAENLVKRYSTITALDRVNLCVYKGEIFGFLGPNGAGKSTFLKILLDLIQPTYGNTKIFNEPSRNILSRKSIGFLPENIRVYQFLTINEFLLFHAKLAEVDKNKIAYEVDRCLSMVGLQNNKNKKIGALSKGMLQRTGIAQAILGKPELLLLDEPTSGLDPIGFAELRNLIIEMNHQGTTVFLNSHILSEVERTCDRIAILQNGKIIKSGTKNDLSGKDRHIEVVLENYNEAIVQILNSLSRKPVEIYENRMRIFPLEIITLLDIHKTIVQQDGILHSISWNAESLEELFYRVIKNENVGVN